MTMEVRIVKILLLNMDVGYNNEYGYYSYDEYSNYGYGDEGYSYSGNFNF